MREKIRLLVVTLVGSASVPTLALAQTADPATAQAEKATRSGGLEEIVVTATRREQRLQDIPVTVTAISQDLAKSAGLNEMRDLSLVVPAFNGGRNNGVSQPVIRGVGSSGVSVGDESNVATYIDGVYQADPFSTFLELVEVERVEVLRGPQGTVFGRNATGGLINIITPDPSFTTRGKISGRLGRTRNDANEFDLRAYVTGGLTETIAADFAGSLRKNDGYIKDLVRGGTLGEARVLDLRSKLLFQPSNAVKIILTGEYADQKSSINAVQPYGTNTAGRSFPGVILPSGPWQASLTERPYLDYERYNLSLRTQFDLGGVNLETTTGYMHSDVAQSTDSDASNILLGQIPFTTTAETISQEVRLLSTAPGPFTWLVGGYFFHLDGSMNLNLQNSAGPGNPVTRTNLAPHLTTQSFSGFAEGTYEVVPDFFLTAGGRYTTETRTFEQVVNGTQLPFGEVKNKSDKWTYRVAARYQFAPSANVYASYGTGFKSGVFNAVGTRPVATEPETIRAIEGGIKVDPTRWLRTNLSLFHYDYRDLQVQARDAAGVSYILQNAANAKIYGGELEVSAALSDVNLRGSVSYTHGTYKNFDDAQTFVPLPGGGNQVVADNVSGNRMIRAPRVSFNLGGDWSTDLGGGRLMISSNLFHSGRVYHDFLNLFSQKPYSMLSAEISWTTPDESLRFSLWGNNLTNAAVFQQIRPGALGTDVIYERPRRIGIGAEYRF